MTETSPMASANRLDGDTADLDEAAKAELRTGVGRALFGVEARIRVVDRTKDLIKSGGEWISSVELENELMAHPKVAEAAVIGVPHPKWSERPLACVVVKPGEENEHAWASRRDRVG